MNLIHIVALLAVIQYLYFGVRVGRARSRYGIKAPAVSGHEMFDRAVATYPAKCIDSTGSGDTFSGALAVAIGEGKDLVAAVSFANMAASMSVEVEGVVEGIPHRADVDARLAKASRSSK